MLKKFGIRNLRMDPKISPSSATHSRENQEQLFTLIKQVLRSNPMQPGSTVVRRLAVKVIMKEPVDLTTALNITN